MREYYDEDDPPQGNRWCAKCAHWDDECECDDDETASFVEFVNQRVGDDSISPEHREKLRQEWRQRR